jgi:RimJ/RimL family protein N-acetyltransferase
MAQSILIRPPEMFATRRLVLRGPRLSDADDIFDNYAADLEVTHYLTWRPYKEKTEIAPFLQSRLDRWNSGEEFSWAITRTEEDRVIGMIACRVRGHAADIGYVLSRDYWGRGYTTDAASAIVDWAINLETVYCVWAVCDVEN